jgi:hypothetical protein
MKLVFWIVFKLTSVDSPKPSTITQLSTFPCSFFLFFLFETGSCWPWTQNLPASAFQMLELQVCTTCLAFYIFLSYIFLISIFVWFFSYLFAFLFSVVSTFVLLWFFSSFIIFPLGWWFFFFFFWWYRGLNSHLLGRHSYHQILRQPRDRVLWTIRGGWFRTVILLIFASWVVRMIGVSYQGSARLVILMIIAFSC